MKITFSQHQTGVSVTVECDRVEDFELAEAQQRKFMDRVKGLAGWATKAEKVEEEPTETPAERIERAQKKIREAMKAPTTGEDE